MLQINNKKELRAQIHEWKKQGKRIAFVPTMGNLHKGHLSLLQTGRDHADKLVSSIFVNPMQFAAHEDLDTYPRTLEPDCKSLMEHHCDLVYLPEVEDLYPQDITHMTRVEVPDITLRFEGIHRPGHMTGVSTIVLKLFNLVQPDMAVFGKKDYQQWRMIEKMVRDLNLPIDVIAGETVREPDGLAMSSRNQYLNKKQRTKAAQVQKQLQMTAKQIRAGDTAFIKLMDEAIIALSKKGFDIDYYDICHRHTLEEAQQGDPLVIVTTARLGETRLLDNIEV
jgi:pantoate--beta-alanine ligase